MRPADIEQEGDVWLYTSYEHKTEHRDKERSIAIGPRAQAILIAYLDRDETDYVFNLGESERLRRIEQRRNRQTKVQPSQQNRRKTSPNWQRGRRYTTASFRRAIHRATEAAGVKQWSPNQLRHLRATEVRSQFGLDHAQAVLGHATADTTQIHAELSREKAAVVAREIG